VKNDAAAVAPWSDADILLAACLFEWDETGNPVWAWEAIDICREYQCEFPRWLKLYLYSCATRMRSPVAERSKELSKVLPWIFEFPAKRGPGHPLRPDGDEREYRVPAMAFALAITRGAKPADALRAAFDELDGVLADKIDTKTMLTHIKMHFDLKAAPRSNAEWQQAIRTWFQQNYGDERLNAVRERISRNSAVT
jgi:hypothetical protein